MMTFAEINGAVSICGAACDVGTRQSMGQRGVDAADLRDAHSPIFGIEESKAMKSLIAANSNSSSSSHCGTNSCSCSK